MSFHMYACFYLAITVYKEKKEYKEKSKITYFLHKELKFLLYSLCVEIVLTLTFFLLSTADLKKGLQSHFAPLALFVFSTPVV